jgi:carboxyl-terminal processing protease
MDRTIGTDAKRTFCFSFRDLNGAIQDYGRGVILGAPHSFGKGTVQTFVSLNRFLNTNDDYGDLKLTIQKFYRISGNSTQLEGVNQML